MDVEVTELLTSFLSKSVPITLRQPREQTDIFLDIHFFLKSLRQRKISIKLLLVRLYRMLFCAYNGACFDTFSRYMVFRNTVYTTIMHVHTYCAIDLWTSLTLLRGTAGCACTMLYGTVTIPFDMA